MGYTSFSDATYRASKSLRDSKGIDDFDYHVKTAAAVSAGTIDKMEPHASLNPKNVKLRESRDSADHPTSLAIVQACDVTGSMSIVPKIIQEKLPKLMSLLIRKGYVEHPQIMTMGIGDATCDQVPLQVSQFESGNEIDDNIRNLILESGGGGGNSESYEIAFYFLARKTAMDCLEKRGDKGYFFLIADEMAYKSVKKDEVEAVIGDKLQANIPLEDIVEELKRKFHCFYLLPKGSSYYGDKNVLNFWKKLFGQRVIEMENPEEVCETIASLIGVTEGKIDADDVEHDLLDVGVDKDVAKSVSTSIVPYVKSVGVTKSKATADTKLPVTAGGDVERL